MLGIPHRLVGSSWGGAADSRASEKCRVRSARAVNRNLIRKLVEYRAGHRLSRKAWVSTSGRLELRRCRFRHLLELISGSQGEPIRVCTGTPLPAPMPHVSRCCPVRSVYTGSRASSNQPESALFRVPNQSRLTLHLLLLHVIPIFEL